MLANVNRKKPRLEITINWDGQQPLGQSFLFVSRVGGPEFAVYEPIEVQGGNYVFQFDDLLFAHREGRYMGRFVVGVVDYAMIEFDYFTHAEILEVRNADVRSRA